MNKAQQVLEEVRRLNRLPKINESNNPYPDEWHEFEIVLNRLIPLVTTEEISHSLESILFNRLDAPLRWVIENILSGDPDGFVKSEIESALKQGEERTGTEPRAALSAATSNMQDAIYKLNKR